MEDRIISAAPEMAEALRPFAAFFDWLLPPGQPIRIESADDNRPIIQWWHEGHCFSITLGQLRAAATALAKAGMV